MDTFTTDIIQKLKLTIALQILHNEENREIYQEIAKARAPGMLIEAIKKLPDEEIQKIKEKLGSSQIFLSKSNIKFKNRKYIPNTISFKTDENKNIQD